MKVGDCVMVNDPALENLRMIMKRFGEDVGPNHIGRITEITGKEYIIEFPIRDTPIEEESQIAIYTKSMVSKVKKSDPLYNYWEKQNG